MTGRTCQRTAPLGDYNRWVAASRRKWSQHWLANDELAAALVCLQEPAPSDRFLEIGAGEGRFTRALVQRAASVTAIEVDPHCCDVLRRMSAEITRTTGDDQKLRVVEGNVLDLDPQQLQLGGLTRLVGNLPYGIASPILRWTLEHRGSFRDVHFMLPAEVADRVLAEPSSPGRGLLSVLVQWEFEGRVLRRLGPGGFRPPPKIDSAFVRLRPRTPPVCAAAPSHRRGVLEAAFAHKRKTLANALRLADWDRDAIGSACAASGNTMSARAESLSLENFARLAEALPERPA